MGEDEIRRIKVSKPAWVTSLRDTISKTTSAKWTGGVALLVESLLCKCETLSSKPQSHYRKKAKQKTEAGHGCTCL
jgi:hypothetical protein